MTQITGEPVPSSLPVTVPPGTKTTPITCSLSGIEITGIITR